MATFAYTKVADYILDQLWGFASANALKNTIRYIGEEILGDPGSNSDVSAPNATIASGATPRQHGLYRENLVKAWAHLDLAAAGAVTVTDGFNVASASYSGLNLTVTWGRAFANDTYFAIANASNASLGVVGVRTNSYAAGSAIFALMDGPTGNAVSWFNNQDVEVFAVGRQ